MTVRSTPRSGRSPGLRRWHRWCGLAVLGFLLAATLSGTLLVYKKPLIQWLVTANATLPADLDITALGADLDRIARAHAPPERRLIKAPNPEEPYWTLTGEDGALQLLAVGSLTPYDANGWLLEGLALLRDLHVTLLAGIPGEAVLLATGIGGLFLSITGVVLWWPLRRGFRWRWLLPRPLAARLMIQAHRHCGAAVSLVLIMVLLTGSLMLWQVLVAPLLPPLETTALPPGGPEARGSPSAWLRHGAKAVPDGWPTYIRLPDSGAGELSLRFRLAGEWHPNGRTSVTLDSASGEWRISARPDRASPVRRMVNQLYPLHSSYGLGGWYALLILLCGIATLWLGITGGLSYLGTRQRRKTPSFPDHPGP